jgi:hypothetical protein
VNRSPPFVIVTQNSPLPKADFQKWVVPYKASSTGTLREITFGHFHRQSVAGNDAVGFLTESSLASEDRPQAEFLRESRSALAGPKKFGFNCIVLLSHIDTNQGTQTSVPSLAA